MNHICLLYALNVVICVYACLLASNAERSNAEQLEYRSGTTKHLTRHLRYSTARTYVSLDKNVRFFCFYRMHYITLEWRVAVSAHPLQILSLSASQNHFHISSICRINLPVVTVALIFHIWVFSVLSVLFFFFSLSILQMTTIVPEIDREREKQTF